MSEVAVVQDELPTIQELVGNIDNYLKADKFNYLMNQEPPKKWIAKHPYISNYYYLPIDKVEYLLRRVFKSYKIEIMSQGQTFNGVFVTVRVHYIDVVSGDWMFHDGIGAIQLQTAKGTSAADLVNINNGALSMAYPHAKTLAIKDACDMFGKLFGADINRRDTLTPIIEKTKIKKTADEKLTEIKLLLEVDGLILAEDERMHIERIVEEKEEIRYNKCLSTLNKALPKTN
jgi:hypothetical protein